MINNYYVYFINMDKFVHTSNKNNKIKRYAITFGEVAIIHVGSKEIGSGRRNQGFSVPELENIAEKYPNSKVYYLHSELPFVDSNYDAATLVIKKGVDILLGEGTSDLMLQEQDNLQYDTKYFDRRRGKTLNKRARLNITFGPQSIAHSDDYKQYTVAGFNQLPYLKKIKDMLPIVFGEKADNLNAEGNYYFEIKSGIGFHGDVERKIVICICLGSKSTLRYRWRKPGSSENILTPVDLQLEHGDIYIMSEKATGYDWKKRSKWRLVHGAGHGKYIDK